MERFARYPTCKFPKILGQYFWPSSPPPPPLHVANRNTSRNDGPTSFHLFPSSFITFMERLGEGEEFAKYGKSQSLSLKSWAKPYTFTQKLCKVIHFQKKKIFLFCQSL